MSANEQYPDTTGLTFEKVWAALMESRRSFEEWKQAQIEAKAEEEAKRVEEEANRKQLQADEEAKRKQQQAEEEAKRAEEEAKRKQQQAEEEAKRAEEEAKRKQLQAEEEAKAKARAEEFTQDLKKTQKRLSKQLGELSNKMGLLVEAFMSAGAIRRFNAIGYHFTKASTRVKIIDSKTERTRAEADVLLENGDAVIIIEVKTEPSLQDIQEHIRRLQIFREDRNKTFPNDDKKIYGAMAGGIFPNEVQEAALSAGFYVVRHRGDNVKITVPEGFVPKAF